MLARFGKVMVWAPVIISGLLDFGTATCVCVIVVGIGCACRCALAEAEYFAALVQ